MISIESDTSSDDPDLGVEEDIPRGGLREPEVHYRKRSTKRARSCGSPAAKNTTISAPRRTAKIATEQVHVVPLNTGKESTKKVKKSRRQAIMTSSDSVSVSPREDDQTNTINMTKREENTLSHSHSQSKLKSPKSTSKPASPGGRRSSNNSKNSSKASRSSPSLIPSPKTIKRRSSSKRMSVTSPRSTSTSTTPKTTTTTSSTASSSTTSTEATSVAVSPAPPVSPSWWHSGEFTKEDEEFVHTEVELARDICNKKGESVVSDATDLMHHLASAYSTTTQSFVKPNVLVTGITGAGKSTLINSLFGKKLAATGTGVPITQHFTKYDSPDTRAVVYDSKGLEHGHYEEFIETTKAFFKAREVHNLPKKAKHTNDVNNNDNDNNNDNNNDNGFADGGPIHVVWYIVNTAHARFEQFEQELCQRLFAPFPIFFLLNKADLSTQADRDNLRKVIASMALPNCCGIIDIIAEPDKKLKRGFDTCPACGSDDVQCRVKSALLICGDCGHRESLVQEHGLDKVIRATLMILPALVKDNFVAAQNVILSLKDEMSRRVLAEFWEDFSSSSTATTTTILNTIARMLCRLSTVWEFDGHGDEVGQLLASHLVNALKWKRKVTKEKWHKKSSSSSSPRMEEQGTVNSCSPSRHHRGRGGKGGRGRGSALGTSGCKVVLSDAQRVHVVSLGILWNFCLRELSQQLVHEWERGLEEERGECTQTCSVLYQQVFSALREDNLKLIENSLIEKSVSGNGRMEFVGDAVGGVSGAGYGGCKNVRDVICSFDFFPPAVVAAK